jgi:hypothetical protein
MYILDTPIKKKPSYIMLEIGSLQSHGKYAVFDVDETLGYFSQFGAFVDALNNYYRDFSRVVFDNFNELLDLYPEFIRPNMIEILKYVSEMRREGACKGIFIYTNNQGPRIWVANISKYFDYKVGTQVFDKIIAAFKVNGKIVQEGRTTQNKTYDDLIRVANIPKTSEVCFIDDLNHPGMRHPNVLYINVKPYVETLPTSMLIKRYLDSNLGKNILPENRDKFGKSIKKRMGVVDDNETNTKLNLHESNFILLNTPDKSNVYTNANVNVIEGYKKMGDKILFYIKLFFKNKNKSHKLRFHTRRNKHHHTSSVIKTSKSKRMSTSRIKRNHNRNKTHKIGAFMRI